MQRIRTFSSHLWPVISNSSPCHKREILTAWLEKGKFGAFCVPTNRTARGYLTKAAQEPFLNGSSSIYVEEMYKSWLKDPTSVHKSWDAFFKSTSSGAEPGQAYQSPPVMVTMPVSYYPSTGTMPQLPATGTPAMSRALSPVPDAMSQTHVVPRDIEDHLSVQAIIRSYQFAFRTTVDPTAYYGVLNSGQHAKDFFFHGVIPRGPFEPKK